MSGILFIISAPSGSGKSTLTKEVLGSVPNLLFSISYTTRPPRGSEQHGREYYFVSAPEFERMIAADEFLEHACVFGDYYGTARSFLREAEARGKDLVLDIDVQGAAQVKRKLGDKAVSIFILPPSRKELESRLRRRSESEKQLELPPRQPDQGDALLEAGRLLARLPRRRGLHRDLDLLPGGDLLGALEPQLLLDRRETPVDDAQGVPCLGSPQPGADGEEGKSDEEEEEEQAGGDGKHFYTSTKWTAAPERTPSA